MPSFHSLKDLAKFVNGKVSNSMDELGEHSVEVVKRHVQTDVYDVEVPAFYERTFELKESVDWKEEMINGKVQVSVFHNMDLIRSYPPNQHHSVQKNYQPQDYSPYVAATVNDGSSGTIFGFGYWTHPRPYMDNAKRELSKGYVDFFKKSMKKNGLRLAE